MLARRIKKAFAIMVISAVALSVSACGGNDNVAEALEHAEKGEISEARDSLEKAGEQGEDTQLIARAGGIISMTERDYDEAVSCFEEALSYAGGYVTETEMDISYYLMSAQAKAGMLNGAIETCTAILGLRPQESEIWFVRGRLNIENGSYEDGIRDFNIAISRNGSGDPDIYIDIFEYLKSRGYLDDAQDYLSRTKAIDGRLSDFQKGKLAYCREDYESARDFLEKARKEEGDAVILYLGKTYEALSDTEYAASLYKSYCEKHPEDMILMNQYGICLLGLKEYDEAIEVFEEALKQGGGDFRESMEFNRIVACEKMGEFERAAELMKDYTARYPDDEAAQREESFLTQWERFGE